MSVVDHLAHWITEQRTTDLPAGVLEVSGRSAIDALGCAAHGLQAGPVLDVARGFSRGSSDHGDALGLLKMRLDDTETLLTTPEDAAFALAAAGHSQDFDDTHMRSITHPTSPVLGAALVAGAMADASPHDIAKAVAIGQEVSIRVGLSAQGAFAVRGLNTTAISGSIGASASAGYLLERSTREVAAGLSVAAGTAAGTQEWSATGAANKWVQVGMAASAGLKSTLISRAMPHYAPWAIEGKHGLLATHVDVDLGVSIAMLTDDLGDVWRVEELSLKPYPFCHGIHAVLDAINQLVDVLHGVSPDDVTEVICTVPAVSERLICTPWAAKLEPETDYALRFSLPGLVALALDHVATNASPFRGWGADPADLAKDAARRWLGHIRYELDAEDPIESGRNIGVIEIGLSDDRRLKATQEENRGSPGCPMSPQEQVDKFTWNLGRETDDAGGMSLTDGVRAAVVDGRFVDIVESGLVRSGQVDLASL